MNSKKIYIGIGMIVIIFTLFTLYFAFNYKPEFFTIVTDPSFKATFTNKKWNRILDDIHLLDKGYDVYDETGYIGNYNLTHLSKANKWYVYTDKMAEVKKIGEIIGIKSNMKYEIKDMIEKEVTIEDKNIIKNELEMKKMKTNYDLAVYQTYEVDLDNNKEKDKIIVSNLYQSIQNNSDAYSIIVIKIKDKVYTLYYDGNLKDDSMMTVYANIKFVFNLKKDDIIEMIITANSFGQSKSCTSLYEIYDDGPLLKVNC